MPKTKNDILQGTLALLVLKTLDAQGRMHGYAITAHIQRVSADLLRVEEGLALPRPPPHVAGRLAHAPNGAPPRRIAKRASTASPPPASKQLELEEESWARLRDGVTRVLRYA